MTPAERMMAERSRIEKSGNIYVTPFRVAKPMDAASKIMNIMVKADTNICYEECNIILALVAAGIACLTEDEEEQQEMAKTHWKKVVSDPNFIGEGDFQEGEEKILTIDHVNASETVTTAERKSKKAVVHWREKGNKPMILNVARSKNIEKVAGSGYFEDWPGTTVQLYIEHGIKAFGEVVSAVRVRPYKPRQTVATPVPPCTDCGGEIAPAMGKDSRWLAAYTAKRYGVPLCASCAQARAEATTPDEPQETADEPTTELEGKEDVL